MNRKSSTLNFSDQLIAELCAAGCTYEDESLPELRLSIRSDGERIFSACIDESGSLTLGAFPALSCHEARRLTCSLLVLNEHRKQSFQLSAAEREALTRSVVSTLALFWGGKESLTLGEISKVHFFKNV